ncbi:hypothetical protein HHI36_012491 [Cryptolaemus montrouzieri]|uniref:STAR protein homodimerisation region domain-containing protein n=1 Tax=Cryptolaemus montrouzieri TaxID=559131 RepID=A0ABD2NFL4_9CUCU
MKFIQHTGGALLRQIRPSAQSQLSSRACAVASPTWGTDSAVSNVLVQSGSAILTFVEKVCESKVNKSVYYRSGLSLLKNNKMCDNSTPSTQSIADYLAQLLKDRKQLAAFPNVFIHVERLLDEGMWLIFSLVYPLRGFTDAA